MIRALAWLTLLFFVLVSSISVGAGSTETALPQVSGISFASSAAPCAKEQQRLRKTKRAAPKQRRAYFRRHRSSGARRAFVRRQNARLKALQRALDRCLRPIPGPARGRVNDHLRAIRFARPVRAHFSRYQGALISRRTFLLVFRDRTTVAQANALLRSLRASVIGSLPDAELLYLRLPNMPLSRALRIRNKLQRDARVAAATPDVAGLQTQQLPPHNVRPDLWTWEPAPSDPTNGNWGLKLIRAPQLWNLDTFVRRHRAGTDVCAGVIEPTAGADTGHPDLLFDGGSVDGNHDHTTGTSGVIGARWSNNAGVEGVDPWLTRIRARGTPGGGFSGATSAVMQTTFDAALGAECIKALNMSFGFHPNSNPAQATVDGMGNTLESATDAWVANNRGDIFLVGSAGNGGAGMIARRNSAVANGAARLLDDRFLAVESINWNNTASGFSDDGGSVSAPGHCVRTTEAVDGNNYDDLAAPNGSADCVIGGAPAGWDEWWDGTGALAVAATDQSYATSSGTSFAAPHVTGLIAALWKLEPALTVANVRSLVIGAAYTKTTGGHTEPRIDAFAAAMGIDVIRMDKNLQRALVDVDDGTFDGNRRTNPFTGTTYTTVDEVGNRRGDGRRTMRDFRAWRDAYLAIHGADLTGGELPGIELDGPAQHFKRDLNFDGCVGNNGALPAHPVDVPARTNAECANGPEEKTYSRYDFNGDNKSRFPLAARFKQDLDTGACADNGGFAFVASPGCLRDLDVLADADWQLDEEDGYREHVFAAPVDETVYSDPDAPNWEPQRFLLGNRDGDTGAPEILKELPDYVHSFDVHIQIHWDKLHPDYDRVSIRIESWGPAYPVAPFLRFVIVPKSGQRPTVTIPLWKGPVTWAWTAYKSSGSPPDPKNDSGEFAGVKYGSDRALSIQ